jgi:hypothetical protein
MCCSWTCPRDLPVSLMKLFSIKCSRAESCCCESFKTYIIKLFSHKKQHYWYWDYYPQVLDYQDFWTIRLWISRSLLYMCMWVCMCVLHTVSPSVHLIYISWMLVSQLSHFTVAVSSDQALSTIPFPWSMSNHIPCKPYPHHHHFSFELRVTQRWLHWQANCLTRWIISSK